MKDETRDPEQRLDELLDSAGHVETPANLAEELKRKLARAPQLDAQTDDRLDRVLDRLPEPRVPEGLSQRVLAGLESERGGSPVPERAAGVRRFKTLLAAAMIVIIFGIVVLTRRAFAPEDDGNVARNIPEDHVEPGPLGEVPEEELLAVLDALENWELLTSDNVELLLASLDVADETLLQLEAEEAEPTGGFVDSENRETKKG